MILNSCELLILSAPPASGKTYWMTSLQKVFAPNKLLMISPLRALADECNEKWRDEILVMTPEEWLHKKVKASVVIFDEFHLYFYWGSSFRPLMWECFYELTQNASLTILMTATLSREMKNAVSLFSCQFDSLIHVDRGNQQLKFLPKRYIFAPSKSWVMNQIEDENPGKNVKLVFCQYRHEVRMISDKLTKIGFRCVSCVGGEARHMRQKLLEIPEPDFIVATTVLSHGVNLPDIRRIYFLYPTGNIDFWIQMVARGGRRGLSYEVISMEKPFVLASSIKWNWMKNFLLVIILTLKQKLSLRSLYL